MRIWSAIMAAAVTLTMAFGSVNVEAKRLGGGGSTGKQSSNVTQREAKPATPASPAASPAAAAPRKPWGAMLGGLAAGLGLAWLASSLGMGEAFGQVLMFALLALAVMVVVGWKFFSAVPLTAAVAMVVAIASSRPLPSASSSRYRLIISSV